MKTLGEIAYEAWWRKYYELCGDPPPALSVHQDNSWQACADAVSEAIFARLGAVLDEGDAEETFEGPSRDVRDFYPHLSETEVMDVYQAGCK